MSMAICRALPKAATVLVLATIAATSAAPAVFAAGPAEGGMNARTHKRAAPASGLVTCRICAGTKCTTVRVRGRCTRRSAIAALEKRVKQRSGRQKAIRPPVLDDRSYKDLHEESRSRVPRHTPEWSNPNDSDPGATILSMARRYPNAIRVEKVPPEPVHNPEVDDEVVVGFEQGERKKSNEKEKR